MLFRISIRLLQESATQSARLTPSTVVDAAICSAESPTPDGLLCGAEVVDRGVQAHVGLHVDTFPQVGHYAIDAGLKVRPPEAATVSRWTSSHGRGSTYVPAESSLLGIGGIGDGILEGVWLVAATNTRKVQAYG